MLMCSSVECYVDVSDLECVCLPDSGLQRNRHMAYNMCSPDSVVSSMLGQFSLPLFSGLPPRSMSGSIGATPELPHFQ